MSGRALLDTPDHLIERSFNVNVLAHFWVRNKSILNNDKSQNTTQRTVFRQCGIASNKMIWQLSFNELKEDKILRSIITGNTYYYASQIKLRNQKHRKNSFFLLNLVANHCKKHPKLSYSSHQHWSTRDAWTKEYNRIRKKNDSTEMNNSPIALRLVCHLTDL